MRRTEDEWRTYARQNVKHGYIPGRDVRNFYDHGVHLRDYIIKNAGIDFENKWVLDIGCGNGRLAMALSATPGVHYVGVDVVLGSIDFCGKAFLDYHNFDFFHANIRNQRYAPNQRGNPQDYKLPVKRQFDIVVANSFFTHTGEIANAHHYLKLCHDALVKGGLLYSTWFKSPPNKPSNDTKRTVYDSEVVLDMIGRLFTVEKTWAGETASNRNQWRILARKNNV